MLGGQKRDLALGLQQLHLPGLIGRVFHARGQTGAAVIALQQLAVAKLIDVPPDGLGGDGEMIRQRLDRHEAALMDEVEDLLLTRVLGHVCLSMPDPARRRGWTMLSSALFRKRTLLLVPATQFVQLQFDFEDPRAGNKAGITNERISKENVRFRSLQPRRVVLASPRITPCRAAWGAECGDGPRGRAGCRRSPARRRRGRRRSGPCG